MITVAVNGTFYPHLSSATTRQKSASRLISFAAKTVFSRLSRRRAGNGWNPSSPLPERLLQFGARREVFVCGRTGESFRPVRIQFW